jgi:hydroxymethylglutaryl-CoA reductase (NADPH)
MKEYADSQPGPQEVVYARQSQEHRGRRALSIKNRLSDAEIAGLHGIAIDGHPVALEEVRLGLGDGREMRAAQVDDAHPLPFPLRSIVTIQTRAAHLAKGGKHQIEISVETRPFGKLQFKVEDAISEAVRPAVHLPRDEGDDYSPEIIRQRQEVIHQLTGVQPHHIARYSFDPHIAKGNCENFVGVAQVPIGCAGPLRVRGEHADGEFLIPLATSEGTLIASHNRGIKVLNAWRRSQIHGGR